MKKTIFFLFVFAGTSQLKAQQLFRTDPKVSSSLLDKYLTPNTVAPTLNMGLLGRSASNPVFKNYINGASLSTTAFYDSMPVIKLDGNSKMPIAKFDGYSRMPVKGLDIVSPAVNDMKLLPDVSTFKTPY